jgi:type II secretory pathway pseudopilin PulG
VRTKLKGVADCQAVGISLLEVMLALALVTAAVLAILSVYATGLRQSAESERMLKATEMARELMEGVLQSGFEALPDSQTTFDGRVPDPPADGIPPPPYPKRDDLEALVIVDQVEPQLKSVYVKIFYGSRRSVVLQSYVRPE